MSINVDPKILNRRLKYFQKIVNKSDSESLKGIALESYNATEDMSDKFIETIGKYTEFVEYYAALQVEYKNYLESQINMVENTLNNVRKIGETNKDKEIRRKAIEIKEVMPDIAKANVYFSKYIMDLSSSHTTLGMELLSAALFDKILKPNPQEFGKKIVADSLIMVANAIPYASFIITYCEKIKSWAEFESKQIKNADRLILYMEKYKEASGYFSEACEGIQEFMSQTKKVGLGNKNR